ncbi:hypothetical protein Ahia01_000226100, partial [Argonauta hians]
TVTTDTMIYTVTTMTHTHCDYYKYAVSQQIDTGYSVSHNPLLQDSYGDIHCYNTKVTTVIGNTITTETLAVIGTITQRLCHNNRDYGDRHSYHNRPSQLRQILSQ